MQPGEKKDDNLFYLVRLKIRQPQTNFKCIFFLFTWRKFQRWLCLLGTKSQDHNDKKTQRRQKCHHFPCPVFHNLAKQNAQGYHSVCCNCGQSINKYTVCANLCHVLGKSKDQPECYWVSSVCLGLLSVH